MFISDDFILLGLPAGREDHPAARGPRLCDRERGYQLVARAIDFKCWVRTKVRDERSWEL
jgi:hypothetical protein